MRQRERQVVGDAAGEVDVVLGEAIDLARAKKSDPNTPVPSGNGTRTAERAPSRKNHRPCGAAAAELLVGVVHDVRIAVEQPGALRFAELNRRPEVRIVRGGAGHGVHA